jgi:CRP/FNR family cyclic AMP-dependent transcriptional regulator
MSEPTILNNEIRDWLMDCGLFDGPCQRTSPPPPATSASAPWHKGEAIFNEGDAGSFMCIIHTGQVAVQKAGSDGQVITMATLRSGRAFGEMAVLDGERRSASCIAASNCQLLNLGKDSLEKMLNDAPKDCRQDHPRPRRRCPSVCAWPMANWPRNRSSRPGDLTLGWFCSMPGTG